MPNFCTNQHYSKKRCHSEPKKFDKQSLSAILNMRSYEVVEDENAADFLSGIKDDEDLGSDEKVNPILPL